MLCSYLIEVEFLILLNSFNLNIFRYHDYIFTKTNTLFD